MSSVLATGTAHHTLSSSWYRAAAGQSLTQWGGDIKQGLKVATANSGGGGDRDLCK